MRSFFKGWRRKLGVVALGLACLLMAMWVKSGAAGDVVHLATPRHYNMFFSASGRFYWWSMINESGTYRFLWHDDNEVTELVRILDKDRPIFRGQEKLHFSERSFAYSNVAIPLTLLSAYLLISKPHQNPTQSRTPPTPGRVTRCVECAIPLPTREQSSYSEPNSIANPADPRPGHPSCDAQEPPVADRGRASR